MIVMIFTFLFHPLFLLSLTQSDKVPPFFVIPFVLIANKSYLSLERAIAVPHLLEPPYFLIALYLILGSVGV